MAFYTSYQGYYGVPTGVYPRGLFLHPLGYLTRIPPGVPIQGVLQTSTQGISSTLVYTLEGIP